MTTEYRPGIPSHAHIEAATRLGFEWRRDAHTRSEIFTRFRYVDGQIHSNFAGYSRLNDYLTPASGDEHTFSYRPIRPDGTPVDWETLDAEVARVAGPAQPQGFRADLWRRTCRHFVGDDFDRIDGAQLSDVAAIDTRGCLFKADAAHRANEYWSWTSRPTRTDVLTRWAIYQELKPLYDLVDGAMGEAAMPRDVEAEWDRQSLGSAYSSETDGDWVFGRDSLGVFARSSESDIWRAGPSGSTLPLRNFATVLDAVAEARVRARQGAVTPARLADIATRVADAALTPASPEPRRFADVRPDRRGWRWWRVYGHGEEGTRIENQRGWFRWHARQVTDWLEWGFLVDGGIWFDRTVIPTDEQGNPVSWESIGQPAGQDAQTLVPPVVPTVLQDIVLQQTRLAHERIQRAMESAVPQPFFDAPQTAAQPSQFSNNPTTAPLTPENLMRQMQGYQLPPIPLDTRQLHTDTINYVNAEISRAVLGDTQSAALPRFTADELDDVDHSRTTKLDQAALRRGKLPTVEQIAKYREVRAKRTGGTVAEALKESRIDCEVAQYVLERWASGLGDEESLALIVVAVAPPVLTFPTEWIDARVHAKLSLSTLDTTEPPDTAAQQARRQAEERRQRLAQVQAQIAAERATAQPQDATEPGRFDLIEPDPQADPTASIRAWEARQAAAKREKAKVAAMPAKPTTVPRRPAIEVVNAEEGLSRGDVVLALLGRAMHGGC